MMLLGDRLEKIIEEHVPQSVVNAIVDKDDCGCKGRKAKLNKLDAYLRGIEYKEE